MNFIFAHSGGQDPWTLRNGHFSIRLKTAFHFITSKTSRGMYQLICQELFTDFYKSIVKPVLVELF